MQVIATQLKEEKIQNELENNPEKRIYMNQIAFGIDPNIELHSEIYVHEDEAKEFADLVNEAKTNPEAAKMLEETKEQVRETIRQREEEAGFDVDF